MRIEDSFNKQELIDIIKLYYDYENVEINKQLFLSIAKHLEDIKEQDIAFNKAFEKITEISKNLLINDQGKKVAFSINFNEIKSNFPDFFIFLIKYLSDFAEDILIYIKITLHFHFFFNNTDLILRLELKNLPEVFSNFKSLKVNSIVEIKGRIRKISSAYQKNSKVCVIYPNNKEDFHETFQINNKKPNFYSEEYSYVEYSGTKMIRYLIFEIESDISENIKKDLYNKNNKILCQIDETQLSQFVFGDFIKICGIVKTKNDSQKLKKENFFEKIIEIINFSVVNKQLDAQMDSSSINLSDSYRLKLFDYDITEREIMKFTKIANSGIASSLFCYFIFEGFPSSMDLLKHLLILFIFGNTESFNFSILNFCNDDNSSLIIKSLGDFMRSFCFYNDFSLDVHSKEDLLNMKKQQNDKNAKFFKVGRILNAKENMIIFNNLNEKPHENLINFLNNNLYSKVFDVQLVLNNTENHQFTKFSQAKQILIKTNFCSKYSSSNTNSNNKNISLINLNKDFYSLIQNFDVIYIFNDKIDFQKDKKMMRNIIDNQFYNNKKRSFNTMKTQYDPKNENDFTQLLNISSFNERDLDNLEHTDSLQFFKFFHKMNILKFENSDDLKEFIFSDSQLLLKYCIFANYYITPKINEDTYHKILFVGEFIKSTYCLLKSSDFDIFSKAVRLLTIFSVINAKVNLRSEVENKDIVISFLLIKEIFDQILNFEMGQKKENINKTKKNKYTFVVDTIRQLCQQTMKREFNMKELSEACSHLEIHHDLPKIIEQLNYNGTIIKLGNDDFKLC